MIEQHVNWAKALVDCQQRGEAYALATVIATSGSTPRDCGSKMLVTATGNVGSIGGGGLEHLVVVRARELLQTQTDCQELKQFALGAEARQCCGGSMTVLLECMAAFRPQVVIFGAGHVCQALTTLLRQLPIRTTVVDNRPALLATIATDDKVQTLHSADPVAVCDSLASHSYILVMTHDHQLDYALVQRLLATPGWPLLGMIGSTTKAQRFRKRLRDDGFSESEVALLQSPIGLPGLQGKLPMEVAVSVVAQLLLHTQTLRQDSKLNNQPWREMKQLLQPSAASSVVAAGVR
jgi:xanthine dehydrogenase accessory factor